MIFDKYFMVIPVYRVSRELYFAEMNADFEKQISRSWNEDFRKENRELEENWKRSHYSSYGGDWEFNEIIGYIKLFFMGSQVRGEYWSTKPKRKVRTRKKQYQFKELKLAPESEIWEKTNEGVLSAVEEYLARCKKELKKRHLDLREFDSLKNYIEWYSVYKTKNVFA